ncbi:hypothetical protein Stsp01_44070 [Streptomyces sp. NBRC 13847]|nr:hypothetical protein Stsp01_44070 [Streptomyces sp. NBRC 13847]
MLVLSQHVEQLPAREPLAAGAGSVGSLLKDGCSTATDLLEQRAIQQRRSTGPSAAPYTRGRATQHPASTPARGIRHHLPSARATTHPKWSDRTGCWHATPPEQAIPRQK